MGSGEQGPSSENKQEGGLATRRAHKGTAMCLVLTLVCMCALVTFVLVWAASTRVVEDGEVGG